MRACACVVERRRREGRRFRSTWCRWETHRRGARPGVVVRLTTLGRDHRPHLPRAPREGPNPCPFPLVCEEHRGPTRLLGALGTRQLDRHLNTVHRHACRAGQAVHGTGRPCARGQRPWLVGTDALLALPISSGTRRPRAGQGRPGQTRGRPRQARGAPAQAPEGGHPCGSPSISPKCNVRVVASHPATPLHRLPATWLPPPPGLPRHHACALTERGWPAGAHMLHRAPVTVMYKRISHHLPAARRWGVRR